MTAETLGRAAEAIRRETPTGGDDFREFARAVADWLDLWADPELNLWDSDFSLQVERERALAVARTYLGES